MAVEHEDVKLVLSIIGAIQTHDLAELERALTRCENPGGVVNQSDSGGLTPLIQAIRAGFVEAVELLLEAGSDPNLGARLQDAPLPKCIDLREYEIASRIMAAPGLDLQESGFAAAVGAVLGGDTAGVQFLVDHGLDLRQQVPSGADLPAVVNQATTLIFLATRYGRNHPELFQLLVEQGADLSAYGPGGETLAGSLCRQLDEYPESLKVLLAAGIDPLRKDHAGYAPLHYAAANNHLESVRLLLENGAVNHQPADDGTTPLLWSATNPFKDVHEELLKQGAESKGQCPQESAAELSPDWSWAPGDATWGVLSLAPKDGAWHGLFWTDSEEEAVQKMTRGQGSVRGQSPPCLLIRLTASSIHACLPKPSLRASFKGEIKVGAKMFLTYFAPYFPQGIVEKWPLKRINRFMLTAHPDHNYQNQAEHCSHAVLISQIISCYDGWMENLTEVSCRHIDQTWSLS